MSTDHKKIELPFEGVKPLLTTQMPEGKSGLLREPCLRSTLWLSLQWMEVVQERIFQVCEFFVVVVVVVVVVVEVYMQ